MRAAQSPLPHAWPREFFNPHGSPKASSLHCLQMALAGGCPADLILWTRIQYAHSHTCKQHVARTPLHRPCAVVSSRQWWRCSLAAHCDSCPGLLALLMQAAACFMPAIWPGCLAWLPSCCTAVHMCVPTTAMPSLPIFALLLTSPSNGFRKESLPSALRPMCTPPHPLLSPCASLAAQAEHAPAQALVGGVLLSKVQCRPERWAVRLSLLSPPLKKATCCDPARCREAQRSGAHASAGGAPRGSCETAASQLLCAALRAHHR